MLVLVAAGVQPFETVHEYCPLSEAATAFIVYVALLGPFAIAEPSFFQEYASGAVPVAVTVNATCVPWQTGIAEGVAAMPEIAGGLSTVKVIFWL